MATWLTRLNDLLRARARRERWLIYAVVVVLVFAVGDAIWLSPLQRELSSERVQLDNERSAIEALQVEIAQLTAQLESDPNRALREQIAVLKREHKALDAELHKLTVGLIQPAEMTRVLRAMLSDEQGLKLLKLANLPGEPVMLPGTKASDTDSRPYLYRHRLEMIVEGGYLDAVRYLRRLEALDWTFYWDGLELVVERYPKTRVTIRLSTLGLREGWIGV
ncbi:MAG: MSHA biogenesis protein MshJ [Gammaproteobacteria bacterium]